MFGNGGKSAAEDILFVAEQRKNKTQSNTRPFYSLGMPVRECVRRWWHENENIFLFPPAYPSHKHQWTKIDLDIVGCVRCGIVHVCEEAKNIVPCCLEILDDSSVVCALTGVVKKTSSFYDAGISTRDYRINSINPTDSDVRGEKKQEKTKMEKLEIVRLHTENILKLLLYSDAAKESRRRENMRVCKKVQIAFASKYNEMVSTRARGTSICIIDAFQNAVQTFSQFDRHNLDELIPPFEHWESLVSHICLVLTYMDLPRQFSIGAKNENLKNLILSFIYMTKVGLTVQNTVFIPKIEIMQKILPLEVHMYSCFNLASKSITEGENTLKRCINGMTGEKIEQFSKMCNPLRKRKRAEISSVVVV